MSELDYNSLKGRYLIFRKGKSITGSYNLYMAISPGEESGVVIEINTNPLVFPYLFRKTTMDTVLDVNHEVCTEEEFISIYVRAITVINEFMKNKLRPIE